MPARHEIARLVTLALGAGKPPLEERGAPTRYGGYRSTDSSGIAKGLTPAKVATYLQEADQGYPARLCELLEEIEDRDPHLVGILGTRKRAVANLDWELLPPAGDDRRSTRRIVDFCQARLEEIDNFEDGLLDLLDAIAKGYGVVEQRWYNKGGVAGVRHWDYRPQRWFRPSDEDPDTWRLLDQADPVRGIDLEPYRFIVHVSKAKSGFPVRAGLGRVLLWWYLFKNYAVKDWVSYGEIFGAPFRVGRYPLGAKPADITALQTALRQLGVDASAVIPDDMKVEFVGDQRGTASVDVYERLVVLCERGMSKAVLGQTLTTDEGKNGSRALGQVHNDVRQDLVEADAKQLARTLRRGLLTPLVAYNFGPAAPIPEFRFDTSPPADDKADAETQEIRAKVFAAARSMGVPVALAQVQEELQLRAPAAGEDLLPPSAPATDPGAGQAPMRVPWTRDLVVLAQGGATPPPAWLQQAEGELQRILDEGGHVEAWRPLVDRLEREMTSLDSLGQVPDRLLGLLQELDLTALAPSISDAVLTAELMAETQAGLGDRVLEDFPRLPPAEAAAWWTSRGVVTPQQFEKLSAEARAQAFTISRWTSSSALLEAHQLFERTIRDGGTLAEFEDGLAPLLKSQGLGPMKPFRLETMFRTNWATAYSAGRDRQQRRPEALRLRTYFRYHNPDDGRGRRTHAAQNGKVYSADSAFWQVWNPPNGYACRCYKTAHTEAEVRAHRWPVYDELPADETTGAPALPDPGFQRDPAREPHEFDWSGFPPQWREILGVTA